jgi:mannitol-1-/sugar-/sorbitol-6-/2-deoxyglucose-6-phosphatase
VTSLPVTAVILDMDGLLIDTEPAWRAAEAGVFATLGVQLTEAELLETTGQAIGEVVASWRQRQSRQAGDLDQFSDTDQLSDLDQLSDTEIADRITDLVVAEVQAGGEPMAGVRAAIAAFRQQGLGLAIASSSPTRLIDAVCERLGLDDIDVRCSAFDEVNGKPAPDVYLAAAAKLGVSPAACLAIEDSPNGVLAAKAAGMRCLAIPDPLLVGDPRYGHADLILVTLEGLGDQARRVLGLPPSAWTRPELDG